MCENFTLCSGHGAVEGRSRDALSWKKYAHDECFAESLSLVRSAKTTGFAGAASFGCTFANTATSITTVHRRTSAMLAYKASMTASFLIRRRVKHKTLITDFRASCPAHGPASDVRHDAGGMRDKLESGLLSSVLESLCNRLKIGLDLPDL